MNNLDANTRRRVPTAARIQSVPRARRVVGVIRRVLASDRLWIASASVFSRVSNFITNVILARYGGPAVLGTYAAIQNTATTAAAPVLWSVSTSATLEMRAAADARDRQAVIAAHVYWALAIACVCGGGFLLLLHIADDIAPHDAFASLVGLFVVAGMVMSSAMQGALHGAGAYKPASVRLVAGSLLCVIVAIPAVLLFGLTGALAALGFQYLLVATALAQLAGPRFRERHRVGAALRAARGQLVHSVPNVLATIITAVASWVTTMFLVQRSHGIAGVGVLAVGFSWLTIEMMPVTAWGGLSMRALSAGHARSPHAFRQALHHVLAKDMVFTFVVVTAVAICATPLARVYDMVDTPLPTILRLNAATALILTATQVFERVLFCVGEQRAWMRMRVAGMVGKVGLAIWLIPLGLEYAAVAHFCGYLITAVACVVHLRRGRWLRP